ncbi:hypothetical protein ACIP6X_28055 [Streptomyces coeruleorubidus]|uniref:hypothetical protein n=1 Tax=Streptomyces coeruleorubidus TaxID=116188 RepID=UPI003814C043
MTVQITAALARALRLSLDERDHLFVLIGHNAPARFQRSEHVSPTLMRVLDRLDDSPALVQTDLFRHPSAVGRSPGRAAGTKPRNPGHRNRGFRSGQGVSP